MTLRQTENGTNLLAFRKVEARVENGMMSTKAGSWKQQAGKPESQSNACFLFESEAVVMGQARPCSVVDSVNPPIIDSGCIDVPIKHIS